MLVPRKFVCALVALTVLAPPLLACALPGVQMSEEEKACCRHMAAQCGDASMPDSHSCCKNTPSAQTGAFQIKQRDASSLGMCVQVVVASLFVLPAVRVTAPATSILAFPESPPGHNTILRI